MVLGFVPNFYVSYEKNPAPLTAKMKFQLALKVSTDPVTATGVFGMAGIRQAELIEFRIDGVSGRYRLWSHGACPAPIGLLIPHTC